MKEAYEIEQSGEAGISSIELAIRELEDCNDFNSIVNDLEDIMGDIREIIEERKEEAQREYDEELAYQNHEYIGGKL